MSYLRFHHVFFALMLLSVLSAFALPPRVASRAQPQVQGLFAPVAAPVRYLADKIQRRFSPAHEPDGRGADDVLGENQGLRTRVAYLEQRLKYQEQRDAEQKRLGPLGKLSTPFSVVASDSGTRDSLAIRGTTFEGLRQDMIVIHPDGVVGTIDRVGSGGAQIRLITDGGFSVRGAFGRFRRSEDQVVFETIPTATPLVEGAGRGVMVIRMLPRAAVEAANLQVGDWVVVNEASWPTVVQGLHLGRIVKIGARPDAPLFAEIQIAPPVNLMRLREVRVVTAE